MFLNQVHCWIPSWCQTLSDRVFGFGALLDSFVGQTLFGKGGGIVGFFRGPYSFVGNPQSTKQAFVEWAGLMCRMGLWGWICEICVSDSFVGQSLSVRYFWI